MPRHVSNSSGNASSGGGGASSTAETVTSAAQPNITSLGTLTTLTVDDVAIDGKAITLTGSSGDTATLTVGTNGTLDIVTTDAAAAGANITITADGVAEIAGTIINFDASDSMIQFKHGGAVVGRIASNAYYGNVVGDVNGTSDVATTVTVTDNESANEENLIAFVADAASTTGNHALEMDGNLHYNPSSGTLTATSFNGSVVGDVTGNVTGTASGNLGFKYIMVSGQSDVVAERTNDELTLVAGSNITLTTDAAADSITIAAAGSGGNQAGSALYWDSSTTFYRYIQATDIKGNDDAAYQLTVEDDPANATRFGIRTVNTYSEAYGIVPIPYGCKAVGYRMNCASASTAAAISRTMKAYVVYGDITTAAVEVTDGSPTTNTDNTFASSDAATLTFDSSNPQKTLFVYVEILSGADVLIGGWVKFETV